MVSTPEGLGDMFLYIEGCSRHQPLAGSRLGRTFFLRVRPRYNGWQWTVERPLADAPLASRREVGQ